MFIVLNMLLDELHGEWTIFAASTLLGVRWINQGVRNTVPRDFVGEYKYAGPVFFFVLGVLLQVPLILRVMLYHSSGGH